jgi:hypothetical protein
MRNVFLKYEKHNTAGLNDNFNYFSILFAIVFSMLINNLTKLKAINCCIHFSSLLARNFQIEINK